MMRTAAAAPGALERENAVRDAIVAAAQVTRDTASKTVVLVPRRPELVSWTRQTARQLGTQVEIDLEIGTIDVQFSRPVQATAAAVMPARRSVEVRRDTMSISSVASVDRGRRAHCSVSAVFRFLVRWRNAARMSRSEEWTAQLGDPIALRSPTPGVHGDR